MGQPSKEVVARYRSKEDTKERYRQYSRDYERRQLELNPEAYRARKRANQRRNHLKRKFNLTEEQYASLLSEQNNLCGICKEQNSANRDWHVDHDHQTGKVRGILCHHCNLMLGNARDSVSTLEAAIQYLKGAQ